MSKKTFKGSAMLNPVPSVLITSKNNKGKVNVFTVGWIGVATQLQIQYEALEDLYE
ncbi:hypothetical protein [Clostridium botulinum]|uniref:hypothetical protein n=1 Tax=Clostridium botulinum TaxID=1491 RepID=UPI000A60569F